MTQRAGLASVAAVDGSGRAQFWRGFAAVVPLWAGTIPIGVAYGVAARGAGLQSAEAQLMSIIVFSAAAQVSAISLLTSSASLPVLLATVLGLNLQLLLVGLAAGRDLRALSVWRRLGLAVVLTDGAYGVSVARGLTSPAGLFGAGSSMFVGWNAGTALGVLAGQAMPDARGLGLDVVVPLTFLAVLVPLVRSRPRLVVVAVAAACMLLLQRVLPVGVAVLVSAGLASLAGARLAGE
jgi:branched chain amino acid efflux pump